MRAEDREAMEKGYSLSTEEISDPPDLAIDWLSEKPQNSLLVFCQIMLNGGRWGGVGVGEGGW